MNNKKNLVFILSPTYGIVDNWLPILRELKGNDPEIMINCIIPRPHTVMNLQKESVLFLESLAVFDKYFVYTYSDSWIVSRDIIQVNQYLCGNLYKSLRLLEKISIKFQIGHIYRIIRFISNYVISNIPKVKVISSVDDYFNSKVIILYDVYEEGKAYNQKLGKLISESYKKISICHGVDINNGGVVKGHFNKKECREDVECYVFSNLEIDLYSARFNICPAKINPYGIPKHDQWWINYISTNYPDTCQKKYIYIISRPQNSTYLTSDRRRIAIIDILNIASKFNLPVLLKIHPNERLNRDYENIFGKSGEKIHWKYTNTHPTSVGKKCLLAITFFSGVSSDMIIKGIPVIERLDLRGLKDFDNEKSLRDSRGDPVFSLRYLGLVLGANNYSDMEIHVKKIFSDRNNVIEKLVCNYRKIFNKVERVSTIVVSDILESLGRLNK
jgi:hypothetical protein